MPIFIYVDKAVLNISSMKEKGVSVDEMPFLGDDSNGIITNSHKFSLNKYDKRRKICKVIFFKGIFLNKIILRYVA